MASRLEIMFNKKPSYSILFEATWNNLALELTNLGFKSRNVCVITDDKVGELYYKDLEKIISPISKSCIMYSVPQGEKSKSLSCVEDIVKFLLENHFERKDILVALGGGVVGDLTGFVASIYKRGINYIQIPTTLIAQADASIGGKTGIDFGENKNIIGTFKMPDLVYINTSVLSTLDNRQYLSGIGEIIKTALIKDTNFYQRIMANMYEICDKEPDILMEILFKACQIKKIYIEKDPDDNAERRLLSLGHTIGHALEIYSDYKLLHGECVVLGIVCAAFISWKKGLLPMDEYYEIRDMFVPFGLPISADNLDTQKVLELTKNDKKKVDGRVNFVLLKTIGKACVDPSVTDEEILAALDEINFTEEDARE